MKLGMARFAFVFALVGAAACSGDHPSTTEAIIPEEDIAQEVAAFQCDQRMECECYVLAAPIGEDPEAYTRARCVENRELEIAHWQELMSGSGLVYDATCLAQKLSVAQQLTCGDAVELSDLQLDLGCASRCRVYHGTVQNGELCDIESFDNCAQGLRCRPQPTEVLNEYGGYENEYRCESICARAGAICHGYGDECAPDLYCKMDYETYTGEGTCQPLPHEGQFCEDYVCAGGSVCDVNQECVAPIADGEPCDPNVPCRGFCNNTTCEASVTPAICTWDVRGQEYYY